MGKTNLKFRVYVRSFRYIVSGQALITCSLLHGYTKKETDTEKEKLIYYDFKRFCDCSKK